MANAMYAKGLEAFGNAQINWPLDVVKAVLLDLNTYVPDLTTHSFLSDIPALARVSISAALASKQNVLGVMDAQDVQFSAVSGPQSEAIALFKDTGVEGTSQLICFIDTALGLPVTPGGGDIFVVFDNGANKIFRI